MFFPCGRLLDDGRIDPEARNMEPKISREVKISLTIDQINAILAQSGQPLIPAKRQSAFCNTPTAARYAGVAPGTWRSIWPQLVAFCGLKVVQVGRKTIFRYDSIDAAMEKAAARGIALKTKAR